MRFFDFLCKNRLIMIRKLTFTALKEPIARLAMYAYAHNGCAALTMDLVTLLRSKKGIAKASFEGTLGSEAEKAFFLRLATELIVQRVQSIASCKASSVFSDFYVVYVIELMSLRSTMSTTRASSPS